MTERNAGGAAGFDPAGVRKAAEAALDQVRHALDEAALAANRAIDAMSGDTPGLREAVRATLDYTGEVIDDSFDYLAALAAAKRPEDALKAYQDFFARQMSEAAARARRLTEAALKAGGGFPMPPGW